MKTETLPTRTIEDWDAEIEESKRIARGRATQKHTPGPWNMGLALGGSEFTKAFIVFAQNGENQGVAYVAAKKWCTEETCRANAQLISASPDLLAACEAMIGVCEEQCIALGWASVEQYQAEMKTDSWYGLAKAAIAKAKGE
jgi:hypothetical protein